LPYGVRLLKVEFAQTIFLAVKNMPARTLLARIEEMEEAAKARGVFSHECICFPEKETPVFAWPIEQELAEESSVLSIETGLGLGVWFM
jgi:hypothetical protein